MANPLDVSQLLSMVKETDYTNLDWVSMLEEMLNLIPIMTPEWTDYEPSDNGVVLLEQMSNVGDKMAYRTDVLFNETHMQTAALRGSAVALAKLIDYIPRPPVSSEVEIELSTVDSPTDITIPKGKIISSEGDDIIEPIKFTNADEILVPAHTTSVLATFIQGVPQDEILGSSNGLANQFFELSQAPLAYNPGGDNSLAVHVQAGLIEEVWSEVTTLLSAGPSDQVYVVDIDDNDVTTISFGDGNNGAVPVAGTSNIRVEYRTGGGKLSNSLAQDSINIIVTPISGVTAVTNTDNPQGGDDKESLLEIKRNAPRTLRTAWRAVTREDYKTLAEGIAGVAKANAICDPSGGFYFNSINLYIAPTGGGLPSAALKDEITVFFEEREIMTMVTVVSDPVYIPINFEADIHVKRNYVNGEVETLVQQTLDDFFSFDYQDFQADVRLGHLYDLLSDVEGVDYIDILVLSKLPTGVGNITIQANEIPIAGTITLNVDGGID